MEMGVSGQPSVNEGGVLVRSAYGFEETIGRLKSYGMIDHRLNACLVGDISTNEAHGRTTLCLECLPFGFAATSGNDERTLGDEHLCDAFAARHLLC
jgi:hypothetical protein